MDPSYPLPSCTPFILDWRECDWEYRRVLPCSKDFGSTDEDDQEEEGESEEKKQIT